MLNNIQDIAVQSTSLHNKQAGDQSFFESKATKSLALNGVTAVIVGGVMLSPIAAVAVFTSSFAIDYLTNSVPHIQFFPSEKKWSVVKNALRDQAIGMVAAISFNLAIGILMPYTLCQSGQIAIQLAETVRKTSKFAYGIIITMICVVIPIGEEFIFRGMIQGKLKQIQGYIHGSEKVNHAMQKTTRIGITAILFGLAHYHPLQGMENLRIIVYTGVMGAVMSWRTEKESGCLASSSTHHILNNSLVTAAVHFAA